MRISNRIIEIVAVLLVGWSAACNSDTTTAPNVVPSEIATLKDALAPYASFKPAKDAGYNLAITDCMSNGDEGAMGVHFGNGALIDGTADPLHPEVLIYEPGTNGEMSLVGVEFIIPLAVLPKTAPAPVLFGQKFVVNDVFGVWALHVWTHRSNPSGLFAQWNPRVHC
jgi:hypothetical protein